MCCTVGTSMTGRTIVLDFSTCYRLQNFKCGDEVKNSGSYELHCPEKANSRHNDNILVWISQRDGRVEIPHAIQWARYQHNLAHHSSAMKRINIPQIPHQLTRSMPGTPLQKKVCHCGFSNCVQMHRDAQEPMSICILEPDNTHFTAKLLDSTDMREKKRAIWARGRAHAHWGSLPPSWKTTDSPATHKRKRKKCSGAPRERQISLYHLHPFALAKWKERPNRSAFKTFLLDKAVVDANTDPDERQKHYHFEEALGGYLPMLNYTGEREHNENKNKKKQKKEKDNESATSRSEWVDTG